MFNQYGNTNKGCYLLIDTYLSIVSLPDHIGYFVRRVAPPWDHTIWCDDLHLYGADVCFNIQGRVFFLPKTYFDRTQ